MHANGSSKPIGKCRGCPLNLKKSCAIFANPHEQWSHGHKPCKGYMSEALYTHWREEQMQQPTSKTHKEIRQEKAAELKNVQHRDGILNPGGSRW